MDDPIERALAALANADAARQPPAHLERRILAAYDRRRERDEPRRWTAAVSNYRYEAAALIIASSLTTVAYFTLVERSIVPPSVPEPPVQVWAGSGVDVPAVTAVSPQERSEVGSPAVSRRRRRVRPPAARPAPTWRESDDIVHSVHVRMPRAMLSMFGVPLIEPAAAGTVNVELLLGPDGAARTIRIVP